MLNTKKNVYDLLKMHKLKADTHNFKNLNLFFSHCSYKCMCLVSIVKISGPVRPHASHYGCRF